MERPVAYSATVFGDLLSIVGHNFSADTVVRCVMPGHDEITMTPTIVRPSWLVIAGVSGVFTPGSYELHVQSLRGWQTPAFATVILRVFPRAGPVTVLYPGKGATPYTIAIVATPAMRSTKGIPSPDTVLTKLPKFCATILEIIRSLLMLKEDFLTQSQLDTWIRWVVVFDPQSPVSLTTALVEEWGGGAIAQAIPTIVAPYLASYAIQADVVFALHGSTIRTSATGNPTVDETTGPQSASYELDTVNRTHALFPRYPGAVAMSVHSHDAPMPLHEFCHAASDVHSGFLQDLYSDHVTNSIFLIDKKFRQAATNPVPTAFGTYQTISHASANVRWNGEPYPSTWRSYHAKHANMELPNLMDAYNAVAPGPQTFCCLDPISRGWLFDRIWAKAHR
ncbi:MAG: hypothetical protein ABJB74_21595 [Gemmatimonas sp.]